MSSSPAIATVADTEGAETERVRRIAVMVARCYDLAPDALLTATRFPPRASPGSEAFRYFEAAGVACYLARALTHAHPMEIGVIIGGRSRSQVISLARKFALWRSFDQALHGLCVAVEARLFVKSASEVADCLQNASGERRAAQSYENHVMRLSTL